MELIPYKKEYRCIGEKDGKEYVYVVIVKPKHYCDEICMKHRQRHFV